MCERLSPDERIDILARRVIALANGAGDYTEAEREIAIWDAVEQIQVAKDELYDLGVTVH